MTEVLIEHHVCIIGRYSPHFASQIRFLFLCVEEFYSCLFETLPNHPCKQPSNNHRRRAISVSAEKE